MSRRADGSIGTAEAQTNLRDARQGLVRAMTDTRQKVRDATGLELRRSWVAPVLAGAAGLALALWLRRRR